MLCEKCKNLVLVGRDKYGNKVIVCSKHGELKGIEVTWCKTYEPIEKESQLSQ